MQWVRETKEMVYLRVVFSRGFQRRVSVVDFSSGSYENILRLASSIKGGQFLHRIINYQLYTRTLLHGVNGCGAQANENNLS